MKSIGMGLALMIVMATSGFGAKSKRAKIDRDLGAAVKGAKVIEGERATQTNFVVDHHDPYFTTSTDGKIAVREFEGLGGGRASLLCTKAKPEGAYVASYDFVVPKAFPATLWVYEQGRAWAAPFAWRVDKGEWHAVSTVLQMQNRKKAGKDGPSFAWSRLGTVDLSAGKHRLEIRVDTPKEDGHYLLSQDFFAFVPPLPIGQGPPFETRMEQPTPRSVFLWKDKAPGSDVDDGFRPWLDQYLVETDKPRGAVLVCPGGGYMTRSPREGKTIAKRFNEAGYHGFVVHYRVAPHHHPAPFMDAARAMRLIRANAEKWKVKPDRIAACGFSAGGHLVATLGVHFDKWVPGGEPELNSISCRPDALIVGYSMISAEWTARMGYRNLLGDEVEDSSKVREMTLDLHVTDKTPPSFIWHAADDRLVKVGNALCFARALSKNKIPFELHVYPKGGHGMALGEKDPHVGSWVELCCEWLSDMGWGE